MYTHSYLNIHHDELYHYGMPRRSGRYPWGSGDRPYQSVKDSLKGKRRSEYFTQERTIPKGTKMFRTTTNTFDMNNKGSTYVTYMQADRDLYKGGHIKLRDKKQTYEHEMTLNKDLKIPSREQFQDTLTVVIDKNPKLLQQSVNDYLEMLIPKNSFDRWDITTDPNTGKVDTSLWDKFVEGSYEMRKDIPVIEQWGAIAVSLGKSTELKNEVIKSLKNKGYNAMVDEAGVGGEDRMIEGIDPLIIFDSSVLDVNRTQKITSKEEQKSNKNYLKWRRTAWQHKNNW